MDNAAATAVSDPAERVGDLLILRAQRSPRAIALIEPGLEPLTWGDWRETVAELVAQLNDSGIQAGRRVALVMNNGSATASLLLALLDCSSLAPFNPDYRQNEFERFFVRIGIEALVTDADSDHASRRAAHKLGLPIFTAEVSAKTAGRVRLATGAIPVGRVSPASRAGASSLILHTSGSTAEPKIVPLTQANLLASAHNLQQSLALTDADRGLAMMPMFHIGAIVDLLLAPLMVGASLVIPRASGSDAFCRCLSEFEPSWYQGVPTMLRDIVNRLRTEPERLAGTRSLRLVRSVSSALPNRLLHEVESLLDTVVIEIYGMTETAGVICSNPLPPAQQKAGSVGLPCGSEIRIVDERGNYMQAGRRGEVIVRGPGVMAAYEDRDDRRHEDFYDGFFRTGDEAYVDDDGYLFLCGRIKEIINRGGEKISPLEIDRVAEQHPAVQAAAAFAVRHSSLGEEVGLAVIPSKRQSFDEADLVDFLRARLAPHKLPRRILYPRKLPRAAGGKLQRHRLAELLEAQPAGSAARTWTEPDTDLARRIDELWQTALAVEKIGMDDNFFDLGGDSLTAAAIVGELQRWFPDMHPSALYDHPTLRALEALLADLPGGPQDDPERGDASEPEFDDIGDVLRPFMGVWGGERHAPADLIVGRNIDGQRTPLFWCVNGYEEFDALADLMDREQPIYGMRSLYDTGYKSDSATHRLAHRYTEEIRRLQPRGPYLVGGFCEGGKVAFLIAEQLRTDGEVVASLLLQEQFVASPYSGRVAIFICRPGRNNPFYNFLDATRGWRKYYAGDLQLYEMNGRHKDCYRQPDVALVAGQIRRELQRALAYRHDDSIDRRNDLQRLPLDAYQADLRVRPPARVLAGSSFSVEVEITNRSNCDWRPTAESGIILGAKWLKTSGETRTWMAGSSELPRRLHSGESISLPLQVRAPLRLRPFYLELDLVDDGVSWFGDMGSGTCRHLVEVSLLPFN